MNGERYGSPASCRVRSCACRVGEGCSRASTLCYFAKAGDRTGSYRPRCVGQHGVWGKYGVVSRPGFM